MELWIRSQDRTALVKCENIVVVNNWIRVNNEFNVGYFNVLKNGEQRALEVLDEIHQKLIDLQSLEIANDFYKVCKRNLDNVYEMPKE